MSEGLGCIDFLHHMEGDERVRPVAHPPRKVPVDLRHRLKELVKLVGDRIIMPVIESTKWVSSLVKARQVKNLC